MTASGLPAVVRTFSVPVPPRAAFEAFAEDIGEWWDTDFTASGADFATAVIEPRPGGRVYEADRKGNEHAWGSVATWQPPELLTLHWTHGLDSDAGTVVEVRFAAGGDGTSVHFEHRGWAPGQEQERGKFDDTGGWDVLLGAYQDYVASRAG